MGYEERLNRRPSFARREIDRRNRQESALLLAVLTANFGIIALILWVLA
jgi:hypothetical protein